MRIHLPVFLLTSILAAQNTTFVLPTIGLVVNGTLPFASGIGRYQQWYSPAALQSVMPGPERLLQVDFLAGQGVQNATTLDLEVAIGYSNPLGLTGTFDFNFVGPRVVVLSRRIVNLVTGAAGTAVLTIPFSTQFTWDGTSAIVLDFRIYGNGRGNLPFSYPFLSVNATAPGQVDRCWAAGSATAANGTVQSGWGVLTQFTMRTGAQVSFGSGCPGAGGFTPVASTNTLARPGITWTQQVNQAASQRLALWVLGDSNALWGTLPLPLDLGGYIGATGCSLLTDPVVTLFTTTIGGGAGSGIGTIPVSLPSITSYVGMSVFSQWFVADPLANNGILAASAGLWTTVAGVGG